MSADDEPRRPQVTVSTPGELAGAADVLGSDEAVSSRWPRWAGPVVVGALLGALVVPGLVTAAQDLRQERRAAAAEDAERRRDDQAAVRLTDPVLISTGAPGEIAVSLTATTDGSSPAVLLASLRLVGGVFDGMTPQAASGTVDRYEAPADVRVTFTVDCTDVQEAVATGVGLTGVSAVVAVVPPSGRSRELPPVPLLDELLRDTLLNACQLADPLVVPTANVVVVDGKVLVEASVERGEDADLLGFALPGVAVTTSTRLPFRLTQRSTLLSQLDVGRVDCALLGTGPLLVAFRTVSGKEVRVEATAGSQPGGVSLEDHLARLKAERC